MAGQCSSSILVHSRTFYYDSFRDILIATWGGPLLHRRDFLGLKTSMRQLIFCYAQSGLVCNLPVLSSNTIYTGILIIWLAIFYFMRSASVHVTYWVLYSRLCLHGIWYCRYLRWGRGANFLTAVSVYEHFDAVVFWLRVLYSF